MPDDLRCAIRLLRHSPGFSAMAIATIALAIGANAAMFSFVNGVFLRPLPYPQPERIVRVLERLPAGGATGVSTLNYLDVSAGNTVFAFMAAETGWTATLSGGDEPVQLRGARVSAHYFDIFGTTTAIGRTFLPGEDQPGRDRVVLLSHALWESRFGADPAMLGRDILLDGEPHTVVGILPADGPFDRAAAQIWKPLAFQPSNMTRDYRWLGASARLKPGVTLAAARAEMDVIGQRLAAAYPSSNGGWGIAVDRLADVLVGPGLKTAVAVLFAATLFVWLIGCANLANLALARSVAREGEMAVRAALGATRWQLIRQVLVENVAIALCGGAAGAVIGYAMLQGIRWLIPPFALPPAVDIGMNAPVFLFTFVFAVATGLLFGSAPAARGTSPGLRPRLNSGIGLTASPTRRARGALVVAEIALAFVLLVASGVLLRSVVALIGIDPGFTSANVLTAALPLDQRQHADPAALNAYLASVRAAVEAVPGVRRAALTSALPLEGWGYGVPYSIAGRESDDQARRRPAFFKVVSPSYFTALGIRLRAGRVLSESDVAGGPPAAIINETLARREFGDENPIGRRILVPELTAGRTGFGQPIAWEIVGVVAGERITGLADENSAGMYVSNLQSPTDRLYLIVQTATAPQAVQKAVRAAVDTVNRNQALSDVRTLDQIVNQSMFASRVVATLVAAFAGVALLLAAVGIYGVMSYTAVQRTREMGIRAALGAGAWQLRLLIVKAGAQLTLAGLAIGLAAMFPAIDVISAMLYGVSPYDPPTVGVVAALLAAVAGVACWVPAWRMTRADPLDTLRHR